MREQNLQEYYALKHRVEQLKDRIKFDKGEEQENARRLLEKVEKKLKLYEETHGISKENPEEFFNNTAYNSNFWEVGETRSESELVDALGVLYMIFGSTYQTRLNHHVYKIHFKEQTDKQGAFYRVISDIYEDGVKICQDVVIGFWASRYGDDRCTDMQLSSAMHGRIKKYNRACGMLYQVLLDELKDIWNSYFDEQKALPMSDNYELLYCSGPQRDFGKRLTIDEELSTDERVEVINKVEQQITSGKMRYEVMFSSTFNVAVHKQYTSLKEFLEESGVVYHVKNDGVYIFNVAKHKYGKLVGYKYVDTPPRMNSLSLLM